MIHLSPAGNTCGRYVPRKTGSGWPRHSSLLIGWGDHPRGKGYVNWIACLRRRGDIESVIHRVDRHMIPGVDRQVGA